MAINLTCWNTVTGRKNQTRNLLGGASARAATRAASHPEIEPCRRRCL